VNKRQHTKLIIALALLHFVISLLLQAIASVYALSSTTILHEIIVWLAMTIGFPVFYFWAGIIGKQFMGGAGLLFLLLLNSLLWVSVIYLFIMGLRQRKNS
jgi:hypothetical protein